MTTQRERDLRAHEIAEAFGLHDGLARMLSALVTYSDAEGCVRASVATLARRAGRAKRTGELLLSQLEELGIIETTRRRGRGVAERVVNFDAEPSHQLDLFAPGAPQAGRPNPQSASQSATPQPATAACAQPATQVADEVVKLTTEEDAREQPATVTGLAATLSRVLEVLGDAPALFIEELSVNAILQGHPERDGYNHERAAWTVVSWAHEGGLAMSSAPRLLQRALSKQQRGETTGSRFERPAQRGHRGQAAAAGGGHDFSRFKRSAGW